jgi:Outer membrane protein beta-barrel domain
MNRPCGTSALRGGLTSATPCPGDGASTSAKIDWYGTVRGRAGWASGNFLFYGTGGLAYGHVDLSSTYSALSLSTTAQTSSVRAGWVAGAGIEYLLQPNLTLNLGYQYVDLGTASLASSTTLGGSSIAQTASAHAAFHVVTVGFSWQFSPSGAVSMPWQGMYVGGQAGGAWGLNTDATYTSTSAIVGSDLRLKRDITLVGRLDDGLGLHRYRYLWSDTVYVGVMAQEVALIHPDAIVRDAPCANIREMHCGKKKDRRAAVSLNLSGVSNKETKVSRLCSEHPTPGASSISSRGGRSPF